MKREPDDVNEMPPDMVAAFLHCMGADLGLSKWHCRAHFPTMMYVTNSGHDGLDHICNRRKDHQNRHRCVRCGIEIAP